MPFTLPSLPFENEALAPFISAETLAFHHAKHHQAYVTNLNKLLEGKPEADKPLEEIILTHEGPVFNNAAQVWNHTFYWLGLKPACPLPGGGLAAAIARDFGGFDGLKQELSAAATTQFGSGWAWLVSDGNKLSVMKTANADLPMKHGLSALFTIDVWEHAYYIDYRNDRAQYVTKILDNLINWEFISRNFANASA